MRSIGKWFQSDARRWASVLLIGTLVTGSISLVSFAQPSETEPIFKVSVSGKTPKGHSNPKTASSSDAYSTSRIASGSDAYFNQQPGLDWDIPGNVGSGGSLSDWLEQSETDGDFVVCHLYIDLDKIMVTRGADSGSSKYLNNYLNEKQKIEPDWKLKYKIHVNVNPRDVVNNGSISTSWSLGYVEGLNFPEDDIEIPVILNNVEIGTAAAHYTESGEVLIETEITEAIGKFASYGRIYFYYNLEVGFEPVYEETELDFLLPGSEEPVSTLLLASEIESSTEETTPEETSQEETKPEEATPEETSQEETKPEETTPEETSPPETTPEETTKENSGSGSGGGSGDRWKPDLTTVTTEAVPRTSIESTEETIPETTVQETQKPKESKETEKKDKNSNKDKKDTEKQPERNEELVIVPQTIVPFGTNSEAVPGENVTFQMSIRNDGKEPINNIRVRDYLPEHTVFVGAESDGVYGVLNGHQRVTWKIDSLNPGEEKTVSVEVRVFECTPEGYSLKNKVFWEKNSEESVNAISDPSEIMEFSNIAIK